MLRLGFTKAIFSLTRITSLPDHVSQYGLVRAQTLGLYIPDSIKEWLLSGAPRIYDRKDLELPGNPQIALPSILARFF